MKVAYVVLWIILKHKETHQEIKMHVYLSISLMLLNLLKPSGNFTYDQV
jgi:hypothetical protein